MSDVTPDDFCKFNQDAFECYTKCCECEQGGSSNPGIQDPESKALWDSFTSYTQEKEQSNSSFHCEAAVGCDGCSDSA